jgi:uncharacterized peroxidase-related enzyme
MARVAELSAEDVAEEHRNDFIKYRDLFKDFGNQVPVYAHAPIGMKHVYGMSLESRLAETLPARLIEIAVVAASFANRCSYCVTHHSTILADLGLDPNAISNLGNKDVPGLTEVELLVRDYAVSVTERAWGIRDEMFERLHQHFTDAQIVELTMRIGLTGLFNKVNQALGIEMEEGAMVDFIDKGIAPELVVLD